MSNRKYKHQGLKYKTSFYSFNNLFDYALAYYYVKVKSIRSNINKFLINPLMTLFIRKLFYKIGDINRKAIRNC